MSIFNKDFYPTPLEVIQRMIGVHDVSNKIVLEPSSGSGAILDYLNDLGCKTLACENSKELQVLTKKKCDVFLSEDFLNVKKEEVSHIDFIIMNPPFSNGDKHILHAWDVAPDGCVILALCNYETIKNTYTRTRAELHAIIKDYGSSENLGNVFSGAERQTEVEVGYIQLFKPAKEGEDWGDYFSMDEEFEEQENGLIQYNVVRDIVQRYVGACKLYNQVAENAVLMNSFVSELGVKSLSLSIKEDEKETTIELFKVELRKHCWSKVFSMMNMNKFLTSELKGEINKFVEKQSNVPFTMKNIYLMIDMVVQTHGGRMERVFVEIFDKLIQRHDKNRYNLEGWKTNSAHMVNQKFILESVFKGDWSGGTVSMEYGWRNVELVEDLVKALDYQEGTTYIKDIKNKNGHNGLRNNFMYIETNEWIDYGHLEIKGFKKGTMHAKFKERDVWGRFNQIVAKSKGYELPNKF